jgi:hypothetical protein
VKLNSKVPSYDYLSKSGYSSPQELGRTKKANRPKPESRVRRVEISRYQ